MPILNDLSQEHRLTMKRLEEIKNELDNKRVTQKQELSNFSNSLTPSFGFLSRFKSNKSKRGSQINPLLWIKGLTIGYKIIKTANKVLKKRKRRK